MATMDRRKTLSALSNNALNARENGRMSMGPQRSSKAPTKENSRMSLAPPTKTTRQSLAPLPIKRQSLGRPPLPTQRNSLPRQSLLPNRRDTHAPRVDTRPIKDKEYQKENARKLIVYLTKHNYEHPISPKILLSPTGRDFKQIITFLFERIDPNWTWSSGNITQPQNKKQAPDEQTTPFEVEVSSYLKILGYPFALSKNALSAAGSPHTWPSVLAMLVWLTEILNYREILEMKEMEESGSVENTDVLFLDYVTRIYDRFLQGEDEYPEEEKQLAETFNQKNRQIEQEIEKMERACAALEEEQNEYALAKEELEKLTLQAANGKSDEEKLRKLCEELQKHKEIVEKKLEEKAQELNEITSLRAELAQKEADLKHEIAIQPFTPLQLASMKHQHSMLTQSVQNLQQQREKLIEQIHSLESSIETTKNIEIEKNVSEFNHRLIKLSQDWQGAPINLHELMLTVENGSDEEVIVIKPDLKTVIKPQLNTLQTNLAERLSQLNSQYSSLKAKFEVSQADLTDVESRVTNLQQRLKKNEENYRSEKSVMSGKLGNFTAQIDEIEKEIREANQSTSSREELEQLKIDLNEIEKQSQQVLADQEEEIMKYDLQICSLMNELTQHKKNVEQRVAELNDKTIQVKEKIQAM